MEANESELIMFGNRSRVQDVRYLASLYKIYKIGEFNKIIRINITKQY